MPQDNRTQHIDANQTHGFPSDRESNPVILRARIAAAKERINSMMDECAGASVMKVSDEAIFSYNEVAELLQELRSVLQ